MKKPILCLAPMANVTDSAFRFIIAKNSKTPKKNSLDNFLSLSTHFVMWTEFVSADGLCLAPEKGRQKLLKDLEFSEIERPIVAQFFTSRPEHMEKAAKIARELGFDGVDINMGCPDRSVEKQGAGAALIRNPSLAKEIILAAKQGAGDLPVSVKTRLGYNKDELETWLPSLLEVEPAVITIHSRTRKEMSKVPARWERIKRAVEIRDQIQRERPETYSPSLGHKGLGSRDNSFGSFSHSQIISGPMTSKNFDKTLIFGNGDVLNVEDAYKKCKETGADGAMLGRAIFGNPWLFANLNSVEQNNQIERRSEALAKTDISIQERLSVLVEHSKLFEEKFKDLKSFAVMKKHYKAYVKDFAQASELRDILMRSENADEVERLVKNFLNNV